ncbi:MAG TPA: TPM domain-containing protein [Thermodesulfobacteriota bacterium]|nr:TPM domain-containing protein [Thermodesulfobacteriota bacterium]
MLFLYFLICLLLTVRTAFPLEVPEKPKGRVSDYAALLTEEQIATLDAKLQRFEEKTTNQIAVAIFKSLEGESLEDFSIRLAERWKIGARERDNGVILIIFLDDRKMRIEVGYGLEGALTDAIASSIIRNDIAPHFRQGDYYGGIESGIERIMEATTGEYRSAPSTSVRETIRWEAFIPFLIFLIIPFIIALNARSARRRDFYIFGPGGWSSGRRGGFSGGRRSGGGFSGGGGGFGGGGASGGW